MRCVVTVAPMLVAAIGCGTTLHEEAAASRSPRPRSGATSAATTVPDHQIAATACFSPPIAFDARWVWKPHFAFSTSLPDEAKLRCKTDPSDASCAFALATRSYEAGRFDLAGPLSARLASSSRHPRRADAALMLLDVLDAVGSYAEPRRDSCWRLLETAVPKLLDELCTPAPRAGAGRACAHLHVVDVETTRCSECPLSTLSGRDPMASYRTAAAIALTVARRQCVVANEIKRPGDDAECIELLLLAARSFAQAGDVPRKDESLRLLFDPRNELGKTSALCTRLAADHIVGVDGRCPP